METKVCKGRCRRELVLSAFLRRDGLSYSDYCGDCMRWTEYARYGSGQPMTVKLELREDGLPLTAWAPVWMAPEVRDAYYLGYWHAVAGHARTAAKRKLGRRFWAELWKLLGGVEGDGDGPRDGSTPTT